MEHKPFRGAIFAATEEWLVGVDGGLPWHYPEDLKRFKQVTLGTTIVMGRKTFESIGSTPLPNRRNIVVSRNPRQQSGVEWAQSIEFAYELIGQSPSWLIGGAQLFEAAIDLIDLIDITVVPSVEPVGNRTYLMNLDNLSFKKSEKVINPMDSRLYHVRYIK